MTQPLRGTGGGSRRLHAALMVLLLLAMAAAAYDPVYIDMSESVTHFQETYNGHVMMFPGSYRLSSDALVVRSTSCATDYNGLTIQGYYGAAPPTRSTVQMTFTGLTIVYKGVTFRDTMPPNSLIRIVGTSGRTSGTDPYFIMENVVMRNNVTLIIESTTIKFLYRVDDAVVLALRPVSRPMVIDDRSGLYILNSTLSEPSGVLRAGPYSSLTVSNNSALVVDGVSVSTGMRRIMDLKLPFTVSNGSVFRVTNVKIGDVISYIDDPLLLSHSQVYVKEKSLYHVSNISMSSITDPAGIIATVLPQSSWFELDFTSVATFHNIAGFERPGDAAMVFPTTDDQGYSLRLGNIEVPASIIPPGGDKYVTMGFRPTYIEIDLNGRFVKTVGPHEEGKCARASCVPAHSVLPQREGSTCSCVCSNDSSEPSCAGIALDPTQVFWFDSASPLLCGVANCDICDLMDNIRCVICAAGYTLTEQQGCAKA